MRSTNLTNLSQRGSTLVTVMIMGGISSVLVASMLSLSSNSLQNAHNRSDWNAAFFHAENALTWAAQNIADTTPPSANNFYSTINGNLTLPYMSAELSSGTSNFKNAWVSVVCPNAALPNVYLVTASAKVNNKVRTIQATVQKNPPSQIFDYEYFLNNWGWWWGNTITGNGGNRSNWDFDFRYDPTVNGLIYANGSVEENEVPVNPLTTSPPFGGLAGSDPLDMVHSGTPRLTMPNLSSVSNYAAIAQSSTATNGIWIGSTQVVFGVQTNSAKPGLYLVGTAANPIVISNTVVVPGDVVIKGQMTGQGTLYVGGNLYIAGDLAYANGPDFSTPPETMSATNRDAWVAANQSKDLIAFGVRSNIYAGDVTSAEWLDWCFYPSWGLANLGDESQLGADGIAGTPDDGIPFLHPDGTMSAWYDADGDGIMEGNANFANDINMSSARAASISGYPTNNDGSMAAYNSVASNNMGLLDGIFYSNHTLATLLLGSNGSGNVVFNGSAVIRNDDIIYGNTCVFNYDSRIHSRYNTNPNKYINLGLPIANLISLSGFTELPPNPNNL
jgi:Tfp pilus assembly protein PilX